MKIKLEQVIRAVEEASDAYTMFFDTLTGKTVYLPDLFVTGERDEELELLIENEPGRYLRFPTKYEIHEYSIMEKYVDYLPLGRAKQDLAVSIRGKGAFRRFKGTLRYYGLEQQWYDFREEILHELAVRWCRDNELEYMI